MYYGMIVISVIMFGGCFTLQDVYRSMRGSGLRISLESSFLGSTAGLIILLSLNGFSIELTPFTMIMALAASLNRIAFTFCTFKALSVVNLSLFSLFSMLGGMMLPFLQGILFYNEEVTVAKILCILFIAAALFLTLTRSSKTKGTLYCIGIFVLNGMSGVISKLFTSAPFPKAEAVDFSIMTAIFTLVLSSALLLLLFRKSVKESPLTVSATAVGVLGGGINQVANFILIIALAHVDASVQYPMVTGGVMIVSTLICFFGKKKPSRKELLSVLLSFIGLLTLFLIPV